MMNLMLSENTKLYEPTNDGRSTWGQFIKYNESMKELKFRVWNGVEMIYDVTVGKFGAFYVNPGYKGNGLDENDSASLTPLNTRYPDTVPVMQFTGLLDKNRNEIYEGDICKILYTDWPSKLESDPRTIEQYMDDIARVGVIEYSDDGFYFMTTDRNGEPNYSHINPGAHGFVKVIGNKYENPELLKTA